MNITKEQYKEAKLIIKLYKIQKDKVVNETINYGNPPKPPKDRIVKEGKIPPKPPK